MDPNAASLIWRLEPKCIILLTHRKRVRPLWQCIMTPPHHSHHSTHMPDNSCVRPNGTAHALSCFPSRLEHIQQWAHLTAPARQLFATTTTEAKWTCIHACNHSIPEYSSRENAMHRINRQRRRCPTNALLVHLRHKRCFRRRQRRRRRQQTCREACWQTFKYLNRR